MKWPDHMFKPKQTSPHQMLMYADDPFVYSKLSMGMIRLQTQEPVPICHTLVVLSVVRFQNIDCVIGFAWNVDSKQFTWFEKGNDI